MNTYNLDELIKPKNFLSAFILLCLLNILSLFIIHDILISDPQVITGGNQNSVRLYRNISHIVYVIYPLWAFLKVYIISLLLILPFKRNGIEVPLKQVMIVVVLALMGFWIQDLVEIVWFVLINTNYSMGEVENFSSLSVFSLFPVKSHYVGEIFKFLNVYEVIFWIILSKGMAVVAKQSLTNAFRKVSLSYGIFIVLMIMLRLLIYYKTHPHYNEFSV